MLGVSFGLALSQGVFRYAHSALGYLLAPFQGLGSNNLPTLKFTARSILHNVASAVRFNSSTRVSTIQFNNSPIYQNSSAGQRGAHRTQHSSLQIQYTICDIRNTMCDLTNSNKHPEPLRPSANYSAQHCG